MGWDEWRGGVTAYLNVRLEVVREHAAVRSATDAAREKLTRLHTRVLATATATATASSSSTCTRTRSTTATAPTAPARRSGHVCDLRRPTAIAAAVAAVGGSGLLLVAQQQRLLTLAHPRRHLPATAAIANAALARCSV